MEIRSEPLRTPTEFIEISVFYEWFANTDLGACVGTDSVLFAASLLERVSSVT